jgi:D-alanyl-D-alanine carboxypeptidase
LVAGSILAAAPAQAAPKAKGPKVGARTGVLIDAATGEVLWGRDIHRPMLVASTTKILTALVAESVYKPKQHLSVPVEAEQVDGTRFGFQKGMVMTREQLLTALLMVSANDAAETLAVRYPKGGRRGFLAAMQAKCAQLGCTDSTWRDPAGLDAPGHKASAADLAVLGKALLERPVLAKIVGAATAPFRWRGRTQIISNHNKLVRYHEDPGAIGIKTGYTSKANHTLVAAERRRGRTLVAVALGADDIYGDVKALFAYGYATTAPAGAERLGQQPEPEGPPAPHPAAAGAALPDPGALNKHDGGGLPISVPAAAGAALAVLLLGLALIAVSRRRRDRIFG